MSRHSSLPAVVLTMVLAAGVASGCTPSRERRAGPVEDVRIAAAADLRFALDDLMKVYESTAAARVTVTYGSSGTLYAQLVNGAPFDLFLSADEGYPRDLAARGLTMPGTEFEYATGRIAVWVRADSPLDVGREGLKVVTDARVAHVAIANPAHAPYGRAAAAAMKAAGVDAEAQSKLVLGENVAQAMQFVQSGSAEVGIVALSLALAPAVNGTGRYWLVPEQMHPRLHQVGVALRGAGQAALAVRLFLLTDKSREALKRYGFQAPEQGREGQDGRGGRNGRTGGGA